MPFNVDFDDYMQGKEVLKLEKHEPATTITDQEYQLFKNIAMQHVMYFFGKERASDEMKELKRLG